jgi:hypothetical protein
MLSLLAWCSIWRSNDIRLACLALFMTSAMTLISSKSPAVVPLIVRVMLSAEIQASPQVARSGRTLRATQAAGRAGARSEVLGGHDHDGVVASLDAAGPRSVRSETARWPAP